MKNPCTTESCDRPRHGQGLCTRCYYRANRDHILSMHHKWHKTNREKVKANHRTWRIAHRKNHKQYNQAWNETHAARVTIKSHYRYIYVLKLPAYRGMPFFNEWNPNTGGSFLTGEKWITDNLGKKPSRTHQLHVIDRSVGFMPGNLRWVPRDRHQQEEMITKLLLENRTLKLRLGERF